jgi:prepilin-type N-terminal cleavage/methylation domain-containing protein
MIKVRIAMKKTQTYHFFHDGFTILEVMIVITILAIAMAIAIPGFIGWLPDHRLKAAARGVYSNMQLAKMGAVRANANWAMVFNAATNSYTICSDDGGDNDWTDGDEIVEKTVILTDYKSGVTYGHGNAINPVGGVFGGDNISYTPDNPSIAVFNSRGTCTSGYVYLENKKNTTTYAVGTQTTGVIRLLRWTGAAWE